jgi:hypothetical protein
MARLAPVCDVPGCGAHRRPGQRLCADCDRRLPGEIRVGLTEAHHQRRTADWRTLRRQAADFLSLTPRDPVPATPRDRRTLIRPRRAFALHPDTGGARAAWETPTTAYEHAKREHTNG